MYRINIVQMTDDQMEELDSRDPWGYAVMNTNRPGMPKPITWGGAFNIHDAVRRAMDDAESLEIDNFFIEIHRIVRLENESD